MPARRVPLPAIAAAICLAGCAADAPRDAGTEDTEPACRQRPRQPVDAGTDDRPGTPDAAPRLDAWPETEADRLFDDEAPPPLFRIDVAPADWAWLNDHATDETYVPATVEHDGLRFEGAGLRYKGAYGSLYACFDDQGHRTCPKLSLKVSFNAYVTRGRFLGVRKLILNSCNRDPSCLHERLAYAAFRAAGVHASRAVHALVSLNGEAPGIYLLVESIDEAWLATRFADPSGNLYKEAWPRTTDPGAYVGALETNRDDPDTSRMAAWAMALAELPDQDFNAVMDSWIDREIMARYLVVDQMVQNWDGIWKFYCQGDQCGNHNYYVYDDPLSRQFRIIPWDLDYTMTAPNPDMARSWWDTSPEACEIQQTSPFLGVRAPQCDRLLRGLMLLNWERYLARLNDLVMAPGGPLSLEMTLARLDRYRAMLLPWVDTDPLGPAPAAWRRSVSQLRQIVRAQHDQALRLLAEEAR